MRQRYSRHPWAAILLLLAVAGALLGGCGQDAASQVAGVGPQPTGTATLAATSPRASATPGATPRDTAAPQRTSAPPTATKTPARPTPTPTPPPASGGLPLVAFAQLPPEARETIRLIEQGGPFPYDRDGIVFGNRERLLPPQPDGYYHEYTVITPGSPDRGARRIIAGKPGEYYYTDDHYESFRRVQR